MTTLEELVQQAPDATHGFVIDQLAALSGSWRFCLELADPLAGSAVEWHDLTRWYLGDNADRGADEYAGRYRAMTVTLDLLGAGNVLGPYGGPTPAIEAADVVLDAGLLMRMCLFRITGDSGGLLHGLADIVHGFDQIVFDGEPAVVEWMPLWTGRVESWGDSTRARGQIRTHRVVIVDLLGDLVNVPVGANVEEFWETRFENLLTDAGWGFGADFHGKADLMEIPARDAQSSAINEIDATADPISIEWRTRRNGRLVFHPAAYDEEHETGGEWDNPLYDTYPKGLVFSYSPDLTDVEYVQDDEVEPFGISRTTQAVINAIAITMPSHTPYAQDVPTSVEQFGVKPFQASWIVDNTDSADQLLAARSFATAQALPLQTTIDHAGFFPAMALVDHLDRVRIYHQPVPEGSVINATGAVRHINEQRSYLREGGLSWTTTLQFDLDAVSAESSLKPPENLQLGERTSNSIEWFWENPTFQPALPTETQVRMLENGLIWNDIAYPLDGVTMGGLAPNTQYTFQVRYVRRVDGIIVAFSPITTAWPVATLNTAPGPIDEDDEVEIPDIADGDCDLEWELQENDGSGWVTIMSGDQDDLIDNGDGTYSLNLEAVVFDDGSLYRVRSREVCDGTPGPWQDGPSFDPPDDWDDPCPDPPGLADAPFTEPSLRVYFPQICAPDIIGVLVDGTEIAGVHGPEYGEIRAGLTDPTARSVAARADGNGGLVAYGELPNGFSVVGDKTIACRVMVPEAGYVKFWEVANMRLSMIPSGSGWKPTTYVVTPDGDATVQGDEIALSSSDSVFLGATYTQATGTLELFVDNVSVNSTSFGEARDTSIGLPIWQAGAAADGWITDAGLWDEVLIFATNPSVTINQASGQSDPTNVASIEFDVVFSEAVTGFATGDVTLSGTAGGTLVGTVTGSGATYTVTVTGMTSTGTVIASINSAVCTSVATGLPNDASTSTDNTVTFNTPVAGTGVGASAAGTTLTLNATGMTDGHLLVAVLFSASGVFTAPGGWSAGPTDTSAIPRFAVFYKVKSGETTINFSKSSTNTGCVGVLIPFAGGASVTDGGNDRDTTGAVSVPASPGGTGLWVYCTIENGVDISAYTGFPTSTLLATGNRAGASNRLRAEAITKSSSSGFSMNEGGDDGRVGLTLGIS